MKRHYFILLGCLIVLININHKAYAEEKEKRHSYKELFDLGHQKGVFNSAAGVTEDGIKTGIGLFFGAIQYVRSCFNPSSTQNKVAEVNKNNLELDIIHNRSKFLNGKLELHQSFLQLLNAKIKNCRDEKEKKNLIEKSKKCFLAVNLIQEEAIRLHEEAVEADFIRQQRTVRAETIQDLLLAPLLPFTGIVNLFTQPHKKLTIEPDFSNVILPAASPVAVQPKKEDDDSFDLDDFLSHSNETKDSKINSNQ